MNAKFSADTAHLIASPWSLIEGWIITVDPCDSGTDLTDHAMCSGDIRGKYSARQSVDRIVCHVNGFLFGLKGLDRYNRSEDLLADDLHVRRTVIKNGWTDEIALGAFSLHITLTAGYESGPLFHAALDIGENLFHILLSDDRSNIRIVDRITDCHRLGFLLETLYKFIVNALLNDNAGACGADLTLIKENTNHCPFHGTVQIRIRKDHIR